MTTREQRLAEAEARAVARIENERQGLLRIQQKRRVDAQKATAKRRALVGMLADTAGLLAWDDRTLAGVFAQLAALAPCPNPVAVLAGLLAEVSGAPTGGDVPTDTQPGPLGTEAESDGGHAASGGNPTHGF